MFQKFVLCGAMALGVGALGTGQEAEAGHGHYQPHYIQPIRPIVPHCDYYGGPVRPWGGYGYGAGYGYGPGFHQPGFGPYGGYGPYGFRGRDRGRGFFVRTPNFALGIRR